MAKRYVNSKCFVFSADGFEEISFDELCRRRDRDKSYETKRFIPLHGMLMEVTKEQYIDFYKEQRRQKYLLELSIKNKDISIDALQHEGDYVPGVLIDKSVDVEAEAILNITLCSLKQAMSNLTDDEQLLIYRYFYDEMTESQMSKIYGISQQAVSKRIKKVCGKLRRVMEE